MLTASQATRPVDLPGTQNLRQGRAIHAYLEHRSVADPMAQWELDRAARPGRVAAPAGAAAIPGTPAEVNGAIESDTPWALLILGTVATLLLWAYVGWALSPYLVRAIAWLCEAQA